MRRSRITKTNNSNISLDEGELKSKKKYFDKFLSEEVRLLNQDKKTVPVFKTNNLPVSVLIFWGISYKIDSTSPEVTVIRDGNEISVRTPEKTYNKEYKSAKAARSAKFKLETMLKNKSKSETSKVIRNWFYL